jgi:hypothetical protein
MGISGNTVVGYYQDANTGFKRGFSETGGVYTTLDAPGGDWATYAYGISGNTVVGFYQGPSGNHGFTLAGGVYTTLDDPLANPGQTFATGISGNTVVGLYLDNLSYHGFVTTAPEPSTLALLGMGAVALLGYAWRRRRRAA